MTYVLSCRTRVLWLLYMWRLLCYPVACLSDLCAHDRGAGYLTIVAGTCLLGSQFWLFTPWGMVSVCLWVLAILLWLGLLYAFLTAAVVVEPKPVLEKGINGGWLVIVVATQSLVVLGSFVIQLFPDATIVLFFCLALFMLGGMLYLILISLIFYRWIFLPMPAQALTAPYWINMGAVAITTLAGSRLILVANTHPLLDSLAQFLSAYVLMFWAMASWWIPLLVLVALWKHVLMRVALRYGVGNWSMVFPLGMYSVATATYGQALQLDFLRVLASFFVWVALVAWLCVAAGLMHRLWKQWRT